MIKNLVIVGVFCLCLCFAFPLFGRDIEITVEDADLELPLEGALIRSWDGKEYLCDEDGKSLVAVPDNRQVILQIAYPGYENRRLTIPAGGGDRYTAALRLGGVMENRELVIEARQSGANETHSGRSVTISDKELARTAEIGVIEDVMTSIKLLPGVGYAGFFNAQPSIRGGDPGDLMAALDGFYVERPYHWGGGVSIFDPRMVESAKLSHGVFSARYGHTISGLLEVSSKKPSPSDVELELGLSSSAASLNLSLPMPESSRAGQGGIMIMGKLTYWDPFVDLIKLFASLDTGNETLQTVNAVTQAPYIRSGAFTAHYRFTANLEWNLSGFIGDDGIGVDYKTVYDQDYYQGNVDIGAAWNNLQGFAITSFVFNPLSAVAFKAALGGGFLRNDADGDILSGFSGIRYSPEFIEKFGDGTGINGKTSFQVAPDRYKVVHRNTVNHAQARLDLDWDLGGGFIAAAGAQELYSQWLQREDVNLTLEQSIAGLPPIMLAQMPQELRELAVLDPSHAAIMFPWNYTVDVNNRGLSSSGYTLLEYAGFGGFFGAEAGLRLDHLLFMGKDGDDAYTIRSKPALNPRLNLDFGVLKNKGVLDSLSVTAGTGLFSSMNSLISFIEARNGIDEIKPNRSWTSVLGAKAEFSPGYRFTVEGYYKYVFDRAYISAAVAPGESSRVDYRFDGAGKVWGFDFMLQKLESRYWDGWISYTFTHALYNDPHSGSLGISMGNLDGKEDVWYYPSFHRFHNINMVLNLKPWKQVNLAIRFGFASGQPKDKVGEKYFYPVQPVKVLPDGTLEADGNLIQKWDRPSEYDPDERTTPSLPLDIKFSFFQFSRTGKARMEVYAAAENVLSLVYTSQENTSFNSYTGEDATGSMAASYELPVPMFSFGAKWSF
ncbi:MAG: TonB-dependent receptor plug domain-containing protein [Treponema sp.]|jgi:hypothetical protein|nr:TonB-dependent receptor plug domain-containing protein [Treponema sp.]